MCGVNLEVRNSALPGSRMLKSGQDGPHPPRHDCARRGRIERPAAYLPRDVETGIAPELRDEAIDLAVVLVHAGTISSRSTSNSLMPTSAPASKTSVPTLN